MIGIGGSLAAPPLPHHLAYGSVPRRFGQVKRLAEPPIEEGRSSRRKRWIKPAVRSHGEPCASTPTRPGSNGRVEVGHTQSTQLRKPSPSVLPLSPEIHSQSATNPGVQVPQYDGRLAEAEVASPADQVSRQRRDRLRQTSISSPRSSVDFYFFLALALRC